jgi:hypothetical protein
MSRWYLASTERIARESALACERAGLRSFGQIADVNCHGQSYVKRAVASPNFVKCDEEDWICSAGTIIHGDTIGPVALGRIYQEFIIGGIAAVREKTLGHYALAIRHGHHVVIFTDAQGALSLYYARESGFWFVSNSLSLCAKALPVRKVDETKLLLTIFQTNTPGEDTLYSGVKRLFGSQQILIDLKGRTFLVEAIAPSTSVKSWRLPSIHDAITQYLIEVRRVFAQIVRVGPIALLGTGGLDSRTILAALLDQKAAPQLLYAMGNSRLTDYHPQDLEVVKRIAELCQLPFQQLDWAGNQPHTRTTIRDLFENYGFSYEVYGAPEGLLRAFNGGISPYPNLFLGGYGPVFTNSKPWETEKRSFSFADLVDDAMANVNKMQFLTFKAKYRSVFAEEVKIGLHRAGIDFPEKGASLQNFVKAKLFLYIRGEARFLNLVNEFGHYVAPFLMKELHDPLVSIPLKYRVKDEYQIRLIHALAPGLVDVPLYAGWGPARIDLQTFRLIRDGGEQRRSLLYRVAGVCLPGSLRERFHKWYICLKHRILKAPQLQPTKPEPLAGLDREIVASYSQQVMSDPHARRWFTSTSDLTPKVLARIHHYLVGVDSISYSEWIGFTDLF